MVRGHRAGAHGFMINQLLQQPDTTTVRPWPVAWKRESREHKLHKISFMMYARTVCAPPSPTRQTSRKYATHSADSEIKFTAPPPHVSVRVYGDDGVRVATPLPSGDSAHLASLSFLIYSA